MNSVQALFELNWQSVIIGIFVILGFITTAYTLLVQICKIFGIRIDFFERNKTDHAIVAALQVDFQAFNERFDKMEENRNKRDEELKILKEMSENLQVGLKQIIANDAEQRIRNYWEKGYIPETEFDSFCDFLDYATETMNCNHGLKQKYQKCKTELPMLSAEEAIQFLMKKEN